MEKEKNMKIKINQNLKVNFQMEKNGMEKYINMIIIMDLVI